jgi:methionine aminopeptidase
MNMSRLRELSLHEPIVHVYMMHHKTGEMTLEDSMVSMIETLVAQKKQYFDELVKYKQRFGEVEVREPR